MSFRIIDANLNRACEGLRNVEEYCRFILNEKNLTQELKNIRHEITAFFEPKYTDLINSRDTINDVGVDSKNISKENNKTDPLRANIKRVQQALRVLGDYGDLSDKFRYQMYTIEKKIEEKNNMIKQTNIKQTLLKNKNLYLITSSDNFSTEQDFIDKVALALKSGVKILQFREKNKTASEIIKTGQKLRQLCSFYDALFIVNDRIDIAQILDADGVHLGQDDININLARKIIGDDKIIGISTHKPQDAIYAFENGADYIGVGPVFKTPTKPNTAPVSLEYVKWVSENIPLPFFAIGSINENNFFDAINAGATKIAVIRAIMNSNDVQKTVENFNKVLNENNQQN